MTRAEFAEHDRAFQQATQIAKDYIIVGGVPLKPVDESAHERSGSRFDCSRGSRTSPAKLVSDVVDWQGSPGLGEQSEAFRWFSVAHEVNRSQADVAREASISAMELGRSDDAVSFARAAAECRPSDSGLLSNLAIALCWLAGSPKRHRPCAKPLASTRRTARRRPLGAWSNTSQHVRSHRQIRCRRSQGTGTRSRAAPKTSGIWYIGCHERKRCQPPEGKRCQPATIGIMGSIRRQVRDAR